MVELANKVFYCVKMMRLVQWLAGTAPAQFESRILARSFFVYLDAFVKLFPRLRNEVAKTGADAAQIIELKELAKKLGNDYESFYSRIRDKVAAHRQEMPLGELYEAWNEIEELAVSILLEDAITVYKGLAQLHSDMPTYGESMDIYNPLLKRDLRAVDQLRDAEQISVSSDSLGIARNNAVSLIPSGPLQQKMADIIGILAFLSYVVSVARRMPNGSDTKRLLKAVTVVEIISLRDNLFPIVAANPAHQQESLHERTRNAPKGQAMTSVLDAASAQRDIAGEDALRVVRNKICAHIDDAQPLNTLLASLDNVTTDDLNAAFIPLRNAFFECCQSDIRGHSFLIHGQQLKGFDSIENKLSRPYGASP